MSEPKSFAIQNKKWRYLFLSVLFDAVGMISYLFPGVGEFTDIVWAPIAAWLNYRMYKDSTGAVGSFLTLAEEAIPGTDIVPTFTLTWIYTFFIWKGKEEGSETIDTETQDAIEVD